MKNKNVWIFAEQYNSRIQVISYELLAHGRKLASELNTELIAIVLGCKISSEDLAELIERGADKVITMESPLLRYYDTEPYAACMLKLIKDYQPEIIVAGATSTGRTLMPYLAVKANAGLTADCTQLDIEKESGDLLQTRPAIGGNILATIKTPQNRPQMATVRPHSIKPPSRQKGKTGEIIRHCPPQDLLSSRIKRLDLIPFEAEHNIQDAEVIVSVGRGIKKSENIPTVEPLVRKLNAALGATREVVDRGWLNYSHQVGLSGKTVTPKLYIALGVSGAIQHLAGMQTAETIVAVNSDAEAPIFHVADFGIVGNIFEIIPVIYERLEQNRSDDN